MWRISKEKSLCLVKKMAMVTSVGAVLAISFYVSGLASLPSRCVNLQSIDEARLVTSLGHSQSLQCYWTTPVTSNSEFSSESEFIEFKEAIHQLDRALLRKSRFQGLKGLKIIEGSTSVIWEAPKTLYVGRHLLKSPEELERALNQLQYGNNYTIY